MTQFFDGIIVFSHSFNRIIEETTELKKKEL